MSMKSAPCVHGVSHVTGVLTHLRSIVQPIRDSPYGRIGVVADNQGAVFSVITSPQPAP